MSGVTGWILSILGIVVIGTLVDLVLPSGKMNGYIKSVFAAITVLIIVLPLPNLLKNNFRPDSFIFGKEVELQENYIEYSNNIQVKAIERGLKEALAADGITLGTVEIECDFSATVAKVEKVKVNFGQVVIVGQSEHINKYELIRSKISQYLTIDKDVILIYEE